MIYIGHGCGGSINGVTILVRTKMHDIGSALCGLPDTWIYYVCYNVLLTVVISSWTALQLIAFYFLHFSTFLVSARRWFSQHIISLSILGRRNKNFFLVGFILRDSDRQDAVVEICVHFFHVGISATSLIIIRNEMPLSMTLYKKENHLGILIFLDNSVWLWDRSDMKYLMSFSFLTSSVEELFASMTR